MKPGKVTELEMCFDEKNQELHKERPLRRILITVAYDGTGYHGWQLQPNAVTIEGELNKALSELLGEDIRVIGASRTDAGVHANGNLAVFDTRARIPAEKIPYALNRRLPEDIRIQAGQEVAPDFHPRKCDTLKTYEYRILNTKFQNPNKRRNTYWTYLDLDIDKMQQAGNYLVGEHDFTSFCSIYAQSETRIRTITELTVRQQEDEIILRVTGNGFLYNMVRIIAGTLLQAGAGKIQPERIKDILEAKDRNMAGPTAPPQGLTLYQYQILQTEKLKL